MVGMASPRQMFGQATFGPQGYGGGMQGYGGMQMPQMPFGMPPQMMGPVQQGMNQAPMMGQAAMPGGIPGVASGTAPGMPMQGQMPQPVQSTPAMAQPAPAGQQIRRPRPQLGYQPMVSQLFGQPRM